MADGFTPIETQEALDEIVTKRLDKERKKFDGWMSPTDVSEKYKGWMSPEDVQKKYEGWMSPNDIAEQYKGYASPEEIAKKDAEIKDAGIKLTKFKIANELGVPQELADRLSGETEEEIRKDAQLVAGYTKQKTSAPLKNTEPENIEKTDPKKAAYKELLHQMKGEE